MPVFGHAHGVPYSPPVTVAQHLYLARYISSDADGGFATVGLGANDRWVQERDGGSSIPDVGIGVVVAASVRSNPMWLLLAPLAGYGFAWVGHFGFEKNKPATFKDPLYSFIGDWVMYGDILRGKIRL